MRVYSFFALTAALLFVSGTGMAAEMPAGWTMNFTPILVAPEDGYNLGGGADPELKYTMDRDGAQLSAGIRMGGYYARNLFGITAMPTMRLAVPVGKVEPYAAFGMGFGWILDSGDDGIATMSRLGVIFRFRRTFSLGLEGTVEKVEGTDFHFPSLGSMLSFDI